MVHSQSSPVFVDSPDSQPDDKLMAEGDGEGLDVSDNQKLFVTWVNLPRTPSGEEPNERREEHSGRFICLFLNSYFFIPHHSYFLHLSAFPSVFPPSLKELVKCLQAWKNRIVFEVTAVFSEHALAEKEKKRKRKGK